MDAIVGGWLGAKMEAMVSHFLREVVATVAGSVITSAAGSIGTLGDQAMTTGKGVSDPNNPGYDKAGNWMG